MFYAMVENGEIIGVSQCRSGGDVIDVKVSEEIFNNFEPGKYVYSDGEIVINPQYEKDIRITEIKQLLDELDLKSIRALRGGDTEYIERYESEAQALRNELRTLIE